MGQDGRGLRERIRAAVGRLTAAERRVARTLLVDYPLAGLRTVQALADAAGVSTATVLRFVGKLGFATYADFQEALRGELALTLQSPLSRYETVARAAPDTPAGAVRHYLDDQRRRLEEALGLLWDAEVEAVVRLLADVRRELLLLGGRYSHALAGYTARLLHGVRPRVSVVDGQTQLWADRLLDVDRRTVLLVYDFRRYQADVGTFARLAADRGARLVLVTDPWQSKIAAFAHHVLAVPVASPSLFDSLSAATALSEALVFAAAGLLEEARARIADQERLRRPFHPLSLDQPEGDPS